MIEEEQIEAINQGIDLKGYIESRGIALKRKGKGFVGLCPFHEYTNPALSVNTTKNLWQCFGYSAGGDVIRFVELYDKVTFPAVVDRLSGIRVEGSAKRKTTEDEQQSPALSVKEQKLLARVVAYYQHTLTKDRNGLDYLKKERGIEDLQPIKDFGVGYANGTLRDILPDDEEVSAGLKKIGILNPKGRELFYTSIVC